MSEVLVNVGSKPLINITLQGRQYCNAKSRGMTAMPGLMAQGLTVAFGQDCAMEPGYSPGSGDRLKVAGMGLHTAQRTNQRADRRWWYPAWNY